MVIANPDTFIESLQNDFPPPKVTSLGRSIFDPIWREKQHSGYNSEIIHILTGKVKQIMQCGIADGKTGDTIYTPKSMPHRDVFSDDAPFEVYLIHFEWEGEEKLLDELSPEKLADMPGHITAQLSGDFSLLYRDFQRQGAMANQLVNLRLLRIILTLAKNALSLAEPKNKIDTKNNSTHQRRRQIMEIAKKVIAKRYNKPLTLESIAKAVHVSPYHLSHAFSAENEFTLSSYITNIRMEKAAEFLRSGRLNVSEVAYRVGFSDPAYFSRVFKAHYDMLPSKFRIRD